MPYKIVILEDDPAINDALMMLLETEGHDVMNFFDVETFQRSFESPPDLYILDRRVNQADGLVICRQLKDDPRTANVPVIIISASRDTATLLQGTGADFFLEKPFTKTQLGAAVNRLLSREP